MNTGTDKKRFLVSRTYTLVKPAHGREDQQEESDFVYENRPMTLWEAVKQLQDCSSLSVDPVRSPADLTGHEWAISDEAWHYYDSQTESIHVKALNGGTLAPRNLFRLFKLAGLIEGHDGIPQAR